MKDNPMAAILQDTYTSADLHQRLRLLRGALETKVFHKGGDQKIGLNQFLKDQGAGDADLAAINSWVANLFDSPNRDNLYAKLDAVTAEIDKLPVVTIFVPIQLDPAGTTKLGQWFRQNVSATILLNVRFDPTVALGCSLVFGGRWEDYSIDHILRQHREAIMAIIDSYDRPKNQ